MGSRTAIGQPHLFALRQRLAALHDEWDRADRTGQPLWPISEEIDLVQAQIEALESVLGVDSEREELREQIARIEFILANLKVLPGGTGSGARKFWEARFKRLRAWLGDAEPAPVDLGLPA